MSIPALFHYTSEPAAIRICKGGGIIMPAIRHAGPEHIAYLRNSGLAERWAAQCNWLTTIEDLTWETRAACGLTGDRSDVRFEVMPGQDVTPWMEIRGSWPRPATVVLEGQPGARPDTWWVSGGPIKVVPSVYYAVVGGR